MEPDPELILEVGCGDLETLLRDDEERLWSDVERSARSDVRFRRALAAVWAYDSPMYERRMALLLELRERVEVGVRFVVYPETFDVESQLGWRAIEVEGPIAPRRLAPLLRQIADWAEQEHPPPPEQRRKPPYL